MTQIPDAAVQDMPERIYAMPKKDTKHCVVAFDEASLDYHIEYVRADIATLTNEGTKPVDVAAVRAQPWYITSAHLDPFAAGFEAKQAGIDDENNPFAEGTPDAQDWTEGWESASDETAAIRALSSEPAQGEQWHRADSDQSVLFYTMRHDGWNKGQPSMVNDVQVHVSLNKGSKLDLISVADMLFASLPAAPTPEAVK